jgi:hypothetical protein
VLLGLYHRTTGDDKWSRPFDMVRDAEHTFTWSHPSIAEHLARKWSQRPEGCHCENTKIWPLCLTAAGLGLQLYDLLYDLLYDTDHHQFFRSWWVNRARPDYLGFDGNTPGALTTFYYDPTIDTHHRLPAFAASTFVAYYLAAQVPKDARALWDSARSQIDLLDPPYAPVLDPRGSSLYLFLAHEWAVDDLAAAIENYADEQYQPTWTGDSGEFSWGFGLDESYPRGQWNAAMAATEANTAGGWWRLGHVYETSRFSGPTVVGVDFPTVLPTQAWWDGEREELTVSLAPPTAGPGAGATTFRVTGLPAGGSCTAAATNGVGVTSSVVDGDLEITTSAPVSLVVHRRP